MYTWKKLSTYHWKSFESVHAWWDKAEYGVGGKGSGFLLVESINFNQNTFL